MDRRTFVGTLGAIAAATAAPPCAAAAARVYRIGVLEAVPAAENAANLAALRRGLADLGYVEGRNLVIDYRSADGHADRFPALAAALVRAHADVIVARGTPATRAAGAAAGDVPVVMATMGDPRTLVASIARPGGNVTGVTTFSTELAAKRVEVLKELVPGLARIALLHNMGNPASPPEWEETRRAAAALGLAAELVDVRTPADLPRAFDRARALRADALVVGADGLTQANERSIVALAARERLPAAYPSADFVEAGGLVAYAVDYRELYHRFASFVDRILRGAKPGELPVEQPTRFELAINLATARALGLAVPPSLLVRASEVLR